MEKKIKILFGHAFYRKGIDNWYKEILSTAPESVKIDPFILNLNPPSKRLSWPELDSLWRKKDRKLLSMYDKLLKASSEYDYFINYNGINIHPEFLEYLPTKNIYCCFDDPESSTNLSKPVAASYDAAFFGNIASSFQYQSWGCNKIAWLPIFSSPNDFPAESEKELLFTNNRENDIAFVGEMNKYKEKRLQDLLKEFPSAQFFGRSGWENKSISDSDKDILYRTTKIGWNIHNSTGPINIRLFMLPAFGMMQICDNKTGLGQIFELGKEAIGFDTIPEAIELTNYYLTHEEERTSIAKAGYERFWNDYHPSLIWKRLINQLEEWDIPEQNCRNESLYSISNTSSAIKERLIHAKRYGSYIKQGIKTSYDLMKHQNNPQSISSKNVFDDSYYLGDKIKAYIENEEVGAVNVAMERVNTGLPLEWPNIVALNWAITSLIGKSKQIVEIGSGTGAFAYYASVDASRHIECFENDDFARNHAITRCQEKNVQFYKEYVGNLKKHYDLLVSVEVIEHVLDVHDYLQFCSKLANKAIYSTPNRTALRGKKNIGPPDYPYHVREYSSGELYWILKQYYKYVYLYYMPDVYVPWLQPMTVATNGTPIIAECFNE